MKNKKEGEDSKLIKLLYLGIFFLSVFLITSNSWAYDNCRYFYDALIDVDNNPSTGGPVTVVQGSETPHDIQGIDYIVRARAFAENDPKDIVGIFILSWNGSDFDIAGDPYIPHNLGIDNGYQYNLEQADVAEFFASKASLGNPHGMMKIVYHASADTFNPDSANDYTDPFYNGQTSSIPTLSEWGMIVLSILFGFSAIWMMRKKRTPLMSFFLILWVILGIAGFAWALTITLDGQVADWGTLAPSVIDPYGDSSVGDQGEDILAGYITSDTDNIYFRIDIVGGGDPYCNEE